MSTAFGAMRPSGMAATLIIALLGGCGGGSGDSRFMPPDADPRPADSEPATTVAATSPVVPGAPYAGVLRQCTYAGSATQECTLGTLPFLGMETAEPGIADVLERTLVSHPWMGRNLRDVLGELPDDVLALFRSITAVVIASDIRPARYNPRTGAIYLDPDFLWLSLAERDTVSAEPDPRSGFGLDLQFQMPWRYVRDNQRLTVFLNADGSRELDQIVEIMGYLLYHELAHAVDFVPPERFALLDDRQTVPDVRRAFPPVSTAFQDAMPLAARRLEELAAVSFLGEDATPEQRSLQPEALVSDFADDGAVQYYAYTSQFEDFATLFETAMMKWHFGYDKDTAITDRPASGSTDDAVVAWGTRGRLGEHMVQSRVREAGQRIYPGDLAGFEAFLDSQPPPERMRPGDTWRDNLILTAEPSAAEAASAGAGSDQTRQRPDYFLERVRIR